MSTNMRIADQRITGAAWLAARGWVGWQFLAAGREKVSGSERSVWVGDQAGMAVRGFLAHALDMAPGGKMAGPHPEVPGWYATLIRHALLPHARDFSYMVTAGELLVGIALVLGIATRFAAAMGLIMNLSYLLAGTSSIGPVMVMVELPLLLVGATAGYYGLDRFLLPFLHRRVVSVRRTSSRLASAHPALQTG